MSLDEQKTKFRALDEWFCSAQGFNVIQAFIKELASVQELLKGETLLQLGSCGNNLLYCKLRYKHKWLVTPYINSNVTLVTMLNQFPIDRNSVDCIIAPLTIEAFSNEKTPIDEIDRILKPMGYAVFFGINPFSLWGCWLRTAKHTCFGTLSGRLKSVFSIKRAMIHRGYIQCYLSNFYYIPPVKNNYLIDKCKVFNEVGKMISPMPAGFYCFVVQKYQKNLISLTPIESNKNYTHNEWVLG